jgi:2,3-bisphosphoglycerate-dependent phosphoglycerate mutase
MQFYLIRHGAKVQERGDVPLTAVGRQQAQQTARWLTTQLPIASILASPMRRAQETAQLIATELQLPVTTEPRLRERVNWGDDPQQSLPDFMNMWYYATAHRTAQPDVGDSSQQAGDRLVQLLTELTSSQPGTARLVLVTHGGLIADGVRNLFTDAELEAHKPDFSLRYEDLIPECSVTQLAWESGRWQLLALADATHLA